MALDKDNTYQWTFIQDGFPARYSLSILAFFGFVCNYMLRINISMAMVAMVNHSPTNLNEGAKNVNYTNECHQETTLFHSTLVNGSYTLQVEINEDTGEFFWDEKMQSIIIGSFFWGYLLTQLPGGRLAEIFGAKLIFGVSLGMAGVINILFPFAASEDPIYLICLRVLLGIFQGATYPAMHCMLARWAPIMERSRMTSMIYSGSQAGTIFALPFSGFIIIYLGWRWVFFIMGGLSLFWTMLWFIFVHDSPETHPRISDGEKKYILDSLAEQVTIKKGDKKSKVPWKEIFSSMPFWAIIVAGTCSSWGFWTFLVQLPTFMKTILHFDIKKNSLLSALPYLCMWIFGLGSSYLADHFRRTGLLTTTQIRKLSTICCLLFPALILIGVTFVGCNPVSIVVLLTIAVMLCGAKYASYLTNHIDIGPNWAGTLMGIANSFTTIPGWLAPLTAGVLTNGEQTIENWSKVFYITASVYVFGCIFYLIFGQGEVQSWNYGPENSTEIVQIGSKNTAKVSRLSNSPSDSGSVSPASSMKSLKNPNTTNKTRSSKIISSCC